LFLTSVTTSQFCYLPPDCLHKLF